MLTTGDETESGALVSPANQGRNTDGNEHVHHVGKSEMARSESGTPASLSCRQKGLTFEGCIRDD